MHLVPSPPPGLTMEEMVEEAELPGPLRLTKEVGVDWHIFCWVLVVVLEGKGVCLAAAGSRWA